MTFNQWYKDNQKYIDPADMLPWMEAAWDAAIEHAKTDEPKVVWVHPHRLEDILRGEDDEPIIIRAEQPTPIWVPLVVK